jgi:Flp pilus assembly protein TadD
MAISRGMQRSCLFIILTLLGLSLMACGSKKNAEAYVQRGKDFLAAKQYDQAIASFSQAIILNPQMAKAYNNRGIAYCNKNRFDQAIKDFSRTIELDPKSGKAYNNRAVAYLMKGEKDKARQDVEKAISLGIPVNRMLVDSVGLGAAKAAAPSQGGAVPNLAPGKPAQGQPAEAAKGKPEAPGQGAIKKK